MLSFKEFIKNVIIPIKFTKLLIVIKFLIMELVKFLIKELIKECKGFVKVIINIIIKNFATIMAFIITLVEVIANMDLMHMGYMDFDNLVYLIVIVRLIMTDTWV